MSPRIYKPYPYQKRVKQFILDHDRCGLFLSMGLGKTASTLDAIYELIYNRLEIERVLVIAPLRVAKVTWPDEIEGWEPFNELSYAVACGSAKQRIEALEQNAMVTIINRENVKWLISRIQRREDWKWDMVVIDELSSFKSNTSDRFKALRKVIRVPKRVVGLTGTPQPNGPIDLWPQIYLLDQGKRLGRTLTEYRGRYFLEGRRNAHVVFEYIPRPDASEEIYRRISDICISMKKEDYLSLPSRMYHNIDVVMTNKERALYKELKRKSLIELEGKEIVGVNATALSGKLTQFANGAVYDSQGSWVKIHDQKLDALEQLIEEANGQSVLVFYAYKHDLARIKERLAVREIRTEQDVHDWNDRKIPIGISHPASIGHGLNLQQGGHIIIWFGLTWSLELYQQANDRLYRNGQAEPVQIYHILCKDTIDKHILSVLNGKNTAQEALMNYLKEDEGR